MLTAQEILAQTLRGTTEHRHRDNPKRNRILHIEETWALQWHAGSTYGCGYGPSYVSGYVSLVLIPECLKTIGGLSVWETGRDMQGPVTPKKLASLIEVCRAEVSQGREGAARRAQERLLEEFPYKGKK